MAGMISLGQVALSAVGGWTVVWLSTVEFGIPFPYTFFRRPCGHSVGVLVALPALRLRGVTWRSHARFSVTVYTIAINGVFYGDSVTVPTGSDQSQYLMSCLRGDALCLGRRARILRSMQIGLSWARDPPKRALLQQFVLVSLSIEKSAPLAFSRLSAFIPGVWWWLLAATSARLTSGQLLVLQALTLFALPSVSARGISRCPSLSASWERSPRHYAPYALAPSIGSIFFGFGAVQMLSPN